MVLTGGGGGEEEEEVEEGLYKTGDIDESYHRTF